MTLPDLAAMLTTPEGASLERKPESVNQRDLRRTLVAFANSASPEQPAVLFLGLEDDGTVSGVTNTDALQKRIREAAERDCYPPIACHSHLIETSGKVVIAVVVPYSESRPHFSGPAYVRRGSESIAASQEQYEELLHSRSTKCGQIQRWKGKIITVVAIQHILGKIKHVSDTHHKEESECRVLGCDSHTVRLEVIASSRKVSEPIENVSLSYDEERWRPMLLVRSGRG